MYTDRAITCLDCGQAFTFTVPLHVEPGEHIGLECLTTQVYYGESLLPPTQVHCFVDGLNSHRSFRR